MVFNEIETQPDPHLHPDPKQRRPNERPNKLASPNQAVTNESVTINTACVPTCLIFGLTLHVQYREYANN